MKFSEDGIYKKQWGSESKLDGGAHECRDNMYICNRRLFSTSSNVFMQAVIIDYYIYVAEGLKTDTSNLFGLTRSL